jgi:hypothetical protein
MVSTQGPQCLATCLAEDDVSIIPRNQGWCGPLAGKPPEAASTTAPVASIRVFAFNGGHWRDSADIRRPFAVYKLYLMQRPSQRTSPQPPPAARRSSGLAVRRAAQARTGIALTPPMQWHWYPTGPGRRQTSGAGRSSLPQCQWPPAGARGPPVRRGALRVGLGGFKFRSTQSSHDPRDPRLGLQTSPREIMATSS